MRALLVEDDGVLAEAVKIDLVKKGFAVDVATNGIDGEFLGTEEPYDVVVLDLGLPDKPGLEVLKSWRENGNRVPVIILTARDAWHEKVDGFNAGADDYLGKPFHSEELVARMNAVIHRFKQKPGGPLESGKFRLDANRQIVMDTLGNEHTLTHTEFRLLRYFFLHEGHIISKSTLTEHVYDYDSDKDSNVIEVYIKRLREKLGRDLIKTHRGQGYSYHSSE